MKSLFLVIDGIDGCGKGVQKKLLHTYFEKKGLKCHLTSDPTEFDTGKFLRKALQDESLPPETDALLFAADRFNHYYNEILPKLQDGYIVLSDRYKISTIAYQSSQGLSIKWINKINKVPEATCIILLDIDPSISINRLDDRDYKEKFEKSEFLQKVRRSYLDNITSNDIIIDASQSIDKVHKEILLKLHKKFSYYLNIKN